MQFDFAHKIRVWDFRGEAGRRMEAFTDSDEALAAAGEGVDGSDH